MSEHTPTIPHGYRLVSGPHTAAEVEEGWTITAKWARKGHHKSAGWHPRSGCLHDGGDLCCMFNGVVRALCYSDDPERDIYRIEKVSP